MCDHNNNRKETSSNNREGKRVAVRHEFKCERKPVVPDFRRIEGAYNAGNTLPLHGSRGPTTSVEWALNAVKHRVRGSRGVPTSVNHYILNTFSVRKSVSPDFRGIHSLPGSAIRQRAPIRCRFRSEPDR